MKLCTGFANDPDVLSMFNINIIMYIYYIFPQQSLIYYVNANDWHISARSPRGWEEPSRRLRPCAVLWPCTFCSDLLQVTVCNYNAIAL